MTPMKTNAEKGVGLIEVLISLLILSVGMLGVMGLQINAKRSNLEAMQRSIALQLVEDMVGRISMNAYTVDGVDVYLNLGVNKLVEVDTSAINAPAKTCGVGVTCSADELATFDLYQWQLDMAGESVQIGDDADDIRAGGLVQPTGCITGPGDGSGFVTITLAWRGNFPMDQPDLVTLPCGVASGLYDNAVGDAAFRQHVTVRTYIIGLEP